MTEPVNMRVYSGADKATSVAGWADEQGYVVKFVHEPTGHSVEFPALITDFSDSHSPVFQQEHGANMHDPIVTLAKTDRAISFTMTVVNASLEEARHNTQCANLLIQMLYPTVSEEGNFIGDPYIDIHMMSLLMGDRPYEGVACVIDGLDYSVKFEEGVIDAREGILALNYSGKEIYPQSFEISISAKALVEGTSVLDSTSPFPTNYPAYGFR